MGIEHVMKKMDIPVGESPNKELDDELKKKQSKFLHEQAHKDVQIIKEESDDISSWSDSVSKTSPDNTIQVQNKHVKLNVEKVDSSALLIEDSPILGDPLASTQEQTKLPTFALNSPVVGSPNETNIRSIKYTR